MQLVDAIQLRIAMQPFIAITDTASLLRNITNFICFATHSCSSSLVVTLSSIAFSILMELLALLCGLGEIGIASIYSLWTFEGVAYERAYIIIYWSLAVSAQGMHPFYQTT